MDPMTQTSVPLPFVEGAPAAMIQTIVTPTVMVDDLELKTNLKIRTLFITKHRNDKL